MNLYHVSQEENSGYDTYSDFVVACDTEQLKRSRSKRVFAEIFDKMRRVFSLLTSAIGDKQENV